MTKSHKGGLSAFELNRRKFLAYSTAAGASAWLGSSLGALGDAKTLGGLGVRLTSAEGGGLLNDDMGRGDRLTGRLYRLSARIDLNGVVGDAVACEERDKTAQQSGFLLGLHGCYSPTIFGRGDLPRLVLAKGGE